MRFYSKSVEEHCEVPLPDDGRWEALVGHWTRREAPQRAAEQGQNACFVVSVRARGSSHDAAAQMAEMVGLVEAQGDRVIGQLMIELARPDPRTLLRKGVAERVADQARVCGATLLVIDAELSPSQTRNLEDVTGLPVSDREAAILNVFERHATTPRSRLQVEIAHLQYLRPRIRGIGLNMDQQAGGILGSRGPGETASELLARRLDTRIARAREALAELAGANLAQRKHRSEAARIAIVGYTNAGKTTLMNALAGTSLSVRSRPFETLDTTSRCLTRHGGDVLLSDTVGFIRRLPERLLASFEATLTEACEATLLLWVVDASDREHRLHLETTEAVLTRLHADKIPRYYVFNKSDQLQEPLVEHQVRELTCGHPYVVLSAHDQAAVLGLKQALLRYVRAGRTRREIFVRYGDHDSMNRVYSLCRVLAADAEETGMRFTVEGAHHVLRQIAGRRERPQR